jgi:mannose-1-phosphate guanylyltransferase/mannose-6-phosphate isomerase
MFQETALRLQGLDQLAAPLVVCNHDHRFLVAEQLREIDIQQDVVLLEPVGRNTAPALTAAALYLQEKDPEGLMIVLPSDHYIKDIPGFLEQVQRASELAKQGYLVTFGIKPTGPETGFGYIHRGTALKSNTEAYKVGAFVEKPDAERAQTFVDSGEYYWNSGMFLFSVKHFLEEVELLSPEIVDAVKVAMTNAYVDLDFLRLGQDEFELAPSISIDYAVMEKTKHAAVLPLDIGWSDVGSWSALWEQLPKDEDGIVLHGKGQGLIQNSKNCLVHSDKRLVALTGVEDLIIVETADAILVAHKDASQDVKNLVDTLKAEKRSEHEIHRKAYRPWGSYESVDRGDRFQVKRIVVNPGAKLSLQMHHHRAEHWVVVHGTAEVTVNDTVKIVHENQSIYVPLGSSHRLHNPGKIPLHLIEVQSGSYLGEDDIVRTEDIYGRSA